VTTALVDSLTEQMAVLDADPAFAAKMRQVRVTKVRGLLESGEMTRLLLEVFDGPRPTLGVEPLITELTLGGVDAERLCWAVVHRESQRHIRLVWQQAIRLSKSFPDCTSNDLLGWGWQGLRTALRKYDPGLGFAFSTYACVRIQGYMRDGIRGESPIPKRLLTFARKANKAQEALTQEYGRGPDVEAVAAALGRDPSALDVLSRLGPPASLEQMVESNRGEASLLVDRADPADSVVHGELRDVIAQALSTLPEPEAHAVRLLVLDAVPMSEASELAGVSRRLLRARKERGLSLLRPALSSWHEQAVPA
jgi:RNA polymerase sigma factor for flagellar operon FliA